MTNPLQTIPNLPPVISLSGPEQFWVNQAGVDKRATILDVLAMTGSETAFDTVAEVNDTIIPPGVATVRVNGYYAPGDGGAALYVRSANPGPGPGFIQSEDGAWWVISQPFVLPEMFGAKADGGTDDYAAFAAWATFGGTSTLLVSGKHYAIASASLGLNGLSLPSGTVIQGVAKGQPGTINPNITITGSAICVLFTCGDVQNITVRDLWVVGNAVNAGGAYGGAFLVFYLTGTQNDKSGLYIDNVRLDDFCGVYWIGFYNQSDPTGNHTLANCRITNCSFYSAPGIYDPSGATNSGVIFIGYPGMDAGVYDVWVENCYCYCSYTKSMVEVWGAIQNVNIKNNVIDFAGYNIGAQDNSCYAISINDSTSGAPTQGVPNNVLISGNQIRWPYSAGIYVGDVINVVIADNQVSYQQDTNINNNLLKGACVIRSIASGGSATITGNTAINCFQGFFIPFCDNITVTLSDNTAISNVAGSSGLVAWPGANDTGLAILNAYNNILISTGANSQGVFITSSTASAPMGRVTLDGGTYEGSYAAIRAVDWSTGGGVNGGSLTLRNLRLNALPSGQSSVLLVGNTASPILIDGVVIDCANMPAAGVWPAALTNDTNLTLLDLTIKNFASNPNYAAIWLSGCRGAMPDQAVKYENVYPLIRILSTDFGYAMPTWAADIGTEIQNLNNPGNGGPSAWLNTTGAANGWVPVGAGAFLPLTGGTVTGNLYSDGVIVANGGNFAASGPVGNQRGFQLQTNNSLRWWIFEDGTAESGSNAGSNLQIQAFADNGSTFLSTPLQINRASGIATFSGSVVSQSPSWAFQASPPAGSQAAVLLNISAGQPGVLASAMPDGFRWRILLGDGGPESGSNSGSNFQILSYSDTGASLGSSPLSINRATSVATFAVPIVNGSDLRQKRDITPISDALALVKRLAGVSYERTSRPGKRELGLIAQDVQAVVPEAVEVCSETVMEDGPPRIGTDDEPLLGISYTQFTALLVEAVKALTEQNETLMARLKALEAKVA